MSVVIPTRNRSEHLIRCLDSLRAQERGTPAFEVIVVDDHSRAGSFDQISSWIHRMTDLRVSLLALPSGERGAAAARNFGILHAQGDLIGLIDDDAIPATNWVHIASQYFSLYSDISAIVGRILPVELESPFSVSRQWFYDSRISDVEDGMQSQAISARYSLSVPDGLLLVDFLSGGNCAIRTAALREVDYFDTNLPMMHDRDLALRLLRRGRRCAFAPDLRIQHEHTKSPVDSLRKAFLSGWTRFLLAKRYPDRQQGPRILSPWRPIQLATESRINCEHHGNKRLEVSITIASLDYLHQLGYVAAILMQPSIPKRSINRPGE
jgi:GT2 family glycosyltransferase